MKKPQGLCSLTWVVVEFEENTRSAEGGLDTPCSLVFARVLPVLETAPCCPSCAVYLLKFASVAVRVAVQTHAVQQSVIL